MVAKLVDVFDILLLDHRSKPDEMSNGGKAPRGLRLLFDGFKTPSPLSLSPIHCGVLEVTLVGDLPEVGAVFQVLVSSHLML